ncbi:choice-of-anchor L domain-containing protein [Psychroflexus aestuariivivens]|uniref:choice-of-anchor L domain-containing protein n=1 Tax=Psychroflexus aestuariivivens TaxID=1795040 RepID=UPI000FD8893A|nr:choice-of-anchor L domain-containing protein [Psychroflexus aestuariivivens]
MTKKITILLCFFPIFCFSQILVSDDYTPDELIENILVSGDCASAALVSSPNNSNVGGYDYKSYGAFSNTNNSSQLTIDGGIVLSTHNVTAIHPDSLMLSGYNNWDGDEDLEALIQEPDNTYNATRIEFSFVSLVEEVEFKYLLASNEWPAYSCEYADTFAFIVSGPGISNTNFYDHDANPNTPDVELDLNGLNIATLPGTNIPVNPVNINLDTECEPGTMGEFALSQFYDTQNSDNGSTTFNGQTIPLTASVEVIPGQVYQMTLVIADRADKIYNSSVFLEASSFDTGSLDLGEDLTAENGFIECEGTQVTLDMGIEVVQGAIVEWSKDGIIIPNAEGSSLDVDESGEYSVFYDIPNSCQMSDVVIVDFASNPDFDGAAGLTSDFNNIVACSNSNIDLTENDYTTANPDDEFVTSYHLSQSDAENNINSITNPDSYAVNSDVSIFVRVESVSAEQLTGCYDTISFQIIAEDISIGDDLENITECYKPGLPATFDLSINNSLALGNQSSSDFSVYYYDSETDALQNNTNNAIQNITEYELEDIGENTIWVNVNNNFTNDCFVTSNFNIELLENNSPQCEDLSLVSENEINFEIYPNPTSGQLNFKSENGISEINIFDINGKQLIHKRLKQQLDGQLNLESFQKGLYFIQFKNDKNTQIHKIIKK